VDSGVASTHGQESLLSERGTENVRQFGIEPRHQERRGNRAQKRAELFSADARQADEGRSFFSKKGGGNRVGEQIVGDTVRIYSDPAHPLAPSICFDNEGLPIARNVWVENGVLKDLFYSRFWADKMDKKPTAGPANVIMEGGKATMADLIAGTERGVLVTRFWYIRPLDPQTILVTGLTRDGLYLIEKEGTRPVKNMRWNEPDRGSNSIEA
jgi:predicted Zn-dependent protease